MFCHFKILKALSIFANIWSKSPRLQCLSFQKPQLGTNTKMGCENGNHICEDNKINYPTQSITRLLRKQRRLRNPTFFKTVFNNNCVDNVTNNESLLLKSGVFDLRQEPLCPTIFSYIMPRMGKNIWGEWKFIVNIGGYQQAVTVGTCLKYTECKFCLF